MSASPVCLPDPNMDAPALHAMVADLLQALSARDQILAQMQTIKLRQEQLLADYRQDNLYKDAKITKLSHEIAMLRRVRFGKSGEQLSGVQGSLLEETVQTDLSAIQAELELLHGVPLHEPKSANKPVRTRLPEHLPRVTIIHEPDSTVCQCGCQLQRIGEDVAEKLDYVPGVFSVEQHVRGKWVCHKCVTLTQATVPAHVIDKGLATPGLLAQGQVVAKYADHLPLYRQEKIFERAGLKLSRSTLADWVGAFENLRAVVYDFNEGRAGQYAREFLGDWQGSLVCDDYSGYKACFTQGMTEIGCMAHARRKFFELHANGGSQLAEQALHHIAQLYRIEEQVRDLAPADRLRIRQERARPLADALHDWMQIHRQRCARWIRHCQSTGLQPETLGGIDALSG